MAQSRADYHRKWYGKNRDRLLSHYRDVYQQNKETKLAKNRAYRMSAAGRKAQSERRRTQENRELLILLRRAPCEDCGMAFPYYVMEFDHARGEKAYKVSAMTSFSPERIFEEVEKCDVVCANCHRIRTHQRGQLRRGRGKRRQDGSDYHRQ